MNQLIECMYPLLALGACCTLEGCASSGRITGTSPEPTRTIKVELLAIDLSTCSRCTSTDRNIEAAVSELRSMLAEAGVDLQFRKTVVQTAEQAAALRFLSSPTIRINDRDVPIELRESRCGDCTALANKKACGVDCRVWFWQGREYPDAPKGLVVDAILRAYSSANDSPAFAAREPFELPDNLKRFFAARASNPDDSRPCCSKSQATSH